MNKFFVFLLSGMLLLFAACGDDGDDKSGEVPEENGCESVYCVDGQLVQPEIGVRSRTVITVDGYQFKDSNGNGSLDAYEDWRLATEDRVADLVSKMDIEFKLACLVSGGGPNSPVTSNGVDAGVPGMYDASGNLITDTTQYTSTANVIVNLKMRFGGSTDSSTPPATAAKFFNNIQELCEAQELGVPYLCKSDPCHHADGSSNASTCWSMWPQPEGLAAINDPELTRQFGDVVRREFRAVGRNCYLGPMADLATEPRWTRVAATFGEDSRIAKANVPELIRGLQNGDKLVPGGIASVLKHFPGHGPQIDGIDGHNNPGRFTVFPGNNFEEHLGVFRECFKANPAGVMPCYSINLSGYFSEKVGTAFSAEQMQDLLIDDIGWNGWAVSDAGITSMMVWGVEPLTAAERMATHIIAGTHQSLMISNTDVITEAYTSGYLTDDDVNYAASHVLPPLFDMGYFENPYVDETAAASIVNSAENAAAGLDAMRRSIVLLKNEDHDSAVDGAYLPVNEENSDVNEDGSVKVYFDSMVAEADSGQASTVALAANYGGGDVEFVSDLASAELAIIRIRARTSAYFAFGMCGSEPLSFDGLTALPDGTFMPEAMDSNRTAALAELARVQAAIDARATNPNLKIVVVMYARRPGIVSSFIGDIDGFLVDFGATDQAVLDVLFAKNNFVPTAKLPMEIPASDYEVSNQSEDVPADTQTPTFKIGSGMSWAASSDDGGGGGYYK